MADTMQFDLVTPERKLASLQAREIRIPGAEGDFTVMPGHTAVITTLRPGLLTVVGPEGSQDYAVIGGFAEVSPEGVSVLAERGMPIAELNAQILADLVGQAERAAGGTDAGVKLAADIAALGEFIQ